MFTLVAAFLISLGLVALLHVLGRALAGAAQPSTSKSALYASGESASDKALPPGYQPFFQIALFFAVLHLGVIVLASAGASLTSAFYLLGLVLALLALIVG
jgi:NADH:ubiquinone oxidoreductase subunit 3 (subunit A)